MADNDTYGDCTVAGWVHAATTTASVLNQTYTYPGDAAVLAGYAQLLGCTVAQLENDPSQYDVGLDLATVVSAGSAAGGFLGFEIAGAAAINAYTDFNLLRSALYSFGFLYVGVNLPSIAQTQFPNTWHLNGNNNPIEGGHCIVLNGATPTVLAAPPSPLELTKLPGFNLVTWGADIECTENWWRHFGDEVWVLIPQAFVTANHDAVQSLDIAQMKADLATLSKAT
jgi:hypothetical protein